MQQYTYAISGGLADGNRYYVGNGKYFASPMKDLNGKTVLAEDAELNRNDSYRQRTRYGDAVDGYYSTYDLGILTGNEKSYLEGRLSQNDDVDYYFFSCQQKKLYSKMGISSEVTITLENIPKGCEYDLTVYDKYGNQVGMAKENNNGGKELVLPDWDGVTDRYAIRVESRNGGQVNSEETYKIKISEKKSDAGNHVGVKHAEEMFHANSREAAEQIKGKYEEYYLQQLERLHKEQYEMLSDSEKYNGTETVQELLEKMAAGEELSGQESNYLKIFSNLADYERAEASGKINGILYADIAERLQQAGIDIQGKDWGLELDMAGNVSVAGEFDEDTRKRISDLLEDGYADELWDCYMRASDISTSEFNLVSGLRDIARFLGKSTNGAYAWGNIEVDGNGKISGLPAKMCELLNAQESNARYEELKDEIHRFMDYKNEHGIEDILHFKAAYSVSGSGMKIVDVPRNGNRGDNLAYYENMAAIL